VINRLPWKITSIIVMVMIATVRAFPGALTVTPVAAIASIPVRLPIVFIVTVIASSAVHATAFGPAVTIVMAIAPLAPGGNVIHSASGEQPGSRNQQQQRVLHSASPK
jgi:hypothetical protein